MTGYPQTDQATLASTIAYLLSVAASGGGGGGGGGFVDLLYIDAVGTQFFWQDTGTGLNAYLVQAGAYVPYSPVAPWEPFSVQSVSINSPAPLPTGAATAANQTTGNTSLASIVTNTAAAATATAQATGNSTLASIYSALTGTLSVTVVGTPALASGAATSALQSQISGQLPSTLGAKATANSLAVNIANDQTVPVSAASLPLPSGAATSAAQTTGNNSLSTIATNTTGLATAAAQTTGNTSLATIATQTSGLATAAAQTTANTALAQLHTDLTSPTPSSEIAVNVNTAQLLSQPSTNSMAALNATVQWQVEPGCTHFLSLFNGPGATGQFSGTVTFQSSPDGSTWTNINGTPISSPTAQVAQTATAPGLWLVNAPVGTGNNLMYIRANMTAYTSGTVYASLVPTGTASAVLPAPWTYTVTSGQTLVGPIDCSNFAEVYLQISAVTTTVLTVQGTNDVTQATWDTIPVQEVKSQTLGALTISAAGTYRAPLAGYKYFRVQCTTTGTVLTVQGVGLRAGQPAPISSYGSSANVNIGGGTLPTVTTVTTVSTVTAVTSLSQIAASVPQMNIANGSTNKELGVSVATAISQVDQNATAFAGAGSVLGTVVASAAGSGAWVSSEINVSALTLGTATAVFAILQESRGGTNFTDIWTSDPITATGIISMPAIPVAGRRRWRFFNCGGTSTTVTVTITSLELPPMAMPLIRQARDFYAATNPLASMYNSVAQTASNFVLGTLGTATTPLYVEGTKLITAFMVLAGGPTVTTQPVVTLYGSMDGTNWVQATGSTMTAAGNGAYAVSLANTAYKWVKLQVTTAAVYGSGAYTISNIGVNAVN